MDRISGQNTGLTWTLGGMKFHFLLPIRTTRKTDSASLSLNSSTHIYLQSFVLLPQRNVVKSKSNASIS